MLTLSSALDFLKKSDKKFMHDHYVYTYIHGNKLDNYLMSAVKIHHNIKYACISLYSNFIEISFSIPEKDVTMR